MNSKQQQITKFKRKDDVCVLNDGKKKVYVVSTKSSSIYKEKKRLKHDEIYASMNENNRERVITYYLSMCLSIHVSI
jgi:hypothetical protein